MLSFFTALAFSHGGRVPPPISAGPEVKLGSSSDSSIRAIKDMMASLNARDVVFEECLPHLQKLISGLSLLADESLKTPNLLSVLVFKSEGLGEAISKMYQEVSVQEGNPSVLAIYITESVEAAVKIAKNKTFDVIIIPENFNGISASSVASEFVNNKLDVPFIVVTDEISTGEFSVRGHKQVYATIDNASMRCAKAIEGVCKQVYLRHKENSELRDYTEALQSLYVLMARVQWKTEN